MQKVLSIDGSGIRHIIPAIILAEIERRTGKTTSELFGLAAGTSTGGILALGLTKPDQNGKAQYSSEKLIELYKTEGRRSSLTRCGTSQRESRRLRAGTSTVFAWRRRSRRSSSPPTR